VSTTFKSQTPNLCLDSFLWVAVKSCFLGGATYHLKKTKPLSEAQKEAMCIVKTVGGIELLRIGSEGENILTTWEFNNLCGDGIGLVVVGRVTQWESFQGKKP
jgi:hypothetical protein